MTFVYFFKGLSRTLAVELAKDKIRVNCVAPGVIKTKFSEAIAESELVNVFTPLSRPGEVDEVAATVSFLVSDDASYITGECIGKFFAISFRFKFNQIYFLIYSPRRWIFH